WANWPSGQNRATSRPVTVSHRRIVLSPAEASLRPSGVKLIDNTRSSCPLRVWRALNAGTPASPDLPTAPGPACPPPLQPQANTTPPPASKPTHAVRIARALAFQDRESCLSRRDLEPVRYGNECSY